MIASCLPHRLFILVAVTVAWGLVSLAAAEQPAAVTPAATESKIVPVPRAKPQVIYHLPPASSYAAALHSQAKTQRDALPIDSSMPASLQMSRERANEAAARAQQESVAPESNAKSPREAKPRVSSQRPVVRSHPAGKGRGAGNPHGKKSHRK